MGLLGQGLFQSALYNIGEHNDIEADTNRVIEHISEIWEKDYKSYVLKVENLERKMDKQTGDFISRDRKRKQKIIKL